jgi:archaemetzincin
MPYLDLVPILLDGDSDLLDRLGHDLARAFPVTPRIQPAQFNADLALDEDRAQYNSSRLLALLLDSPATTGDRILGIAGVDLFIPILTFVFGEAQVFGPTAVVSIHRLRTEAYGLAADPERCYRRLLTESVHELGHTWGLLHCLRPDCAMHASTYVEEIDLKTPDLCRSCRPAVKRPI